MKHEQGKGKIRINGRLYFYCGKCRRKFMSEKTYSGHKCETCHNSWLPSRNPIKGLSR